MELETYGKILCLKWHFRNDDKELDRNKFKPKSTFNPRNKDAAIEIYFNSLEENIMYIQCPQNKYLTREERSALHNLKNDKSIVIKSADKGSVIVVWDRDDYIKEVEKQLGDKGIYEEVCNDPSTVDVVGLHPNIPHDECLSALRKRLDLRQGKDVTTTPVELA